jgi:two-component system response regulator GlrR
MVSARMVIMALGPQECPEDHSIRLARLLCDGLCAWTVDMQIVTHFPPPPLSPPPDIICLQLSKTRNVPEVIHSFRERYASASLLGLFCIGADIPAAVLSGLLDDLDDYLTCPFRDVDVFPRVQRLLRSRKELTTPYQCAERKALVRNGLVGESRPFLRVLHMVSAVAYTDVTVLILGETGTGKELIARAIHYQSSRRDKPFVPVNCGALPEYLVENELFGHAKGAYTDASSPEKGLIAEAEKGTLFLDEVDTLKISAQVKLLRFLQDREYRSLGSTKNHTADVRIIAASNTDLLSQVQAQRFREDLYYRLNVIVIRLPPLRERQEDILLLASHFLRRYAHHYGRESLQLCADALHKLVAYPWPGNIRELETIIHRAVILASSPVLQREDIDLPGLSQCAMPETHSFREAKTRVLEQFERTYLSNLLTAHEGNVTHAAKHAGEPRRSLQRLLKKYRLNRCGL